MLRYASFMWKTTVTNALMFCTDFIGGRGGAPGGHQHHHHWRVRRVCERIRNFRWRWRHVAAARKGRQPEQLRRFRVKVRTNVCRMRSELVPLISRQPQHRCSTNVVLRTLYSILYISCMLRAFLYHTFQKSTRARARFARLQISRVCETRRARLCTRVGRCVIIFSIARQSRRRRNL